MDVANLTAAFRVTYEAQVLGTLVQHVPLRDQLQITKQLKDNLKIRNTA